MAWCQFVPPSTQLAESFSIIAETNDPNGEPKPDLWWEHIFYYSSVQDH